jgi:cation transport regulator
MPPPYKNKKDLPDLVQQLLPEHGQEIWKEAANSAWEQYKDPGERRDPKESREEVTYKVAWAAVEQEYEKDKRTGEWRRKKEKD